MEDKKKNKGWDVEENKDTPSPSPQPSPEGRGSMVKIRFKQGRSAEGVTVGEDGTAMVDAVTARYLINIGYAEEI